MTSRILMLYFSFYLIKRLIIQLKNIRLNAETFTAINYLTWQTIKQFKSKSYK